MIKTFDSFSRYLWTQISTFFLAYYVWCRYEIVLSCWYLTHVLSPGEDEQLATAAAVITTGHGEEFLLAVRVVLHGEGGVGGAQLPAAGSVSATVRYSCLADVLLSVSRIMFESKSLLAPESGYIITLKFLYIWFRISPFVNNLMRLKVLKSKKTDSEKSSGEVL